MNDIALILLVVWAIGVVVDAGLLFTAVAKGYRTKEPARVILLVVLWPISIPVTLNNLRKHKKRIREIVEMDKRADEEYKYSDGLPKIFLNDNGGREEWRTPNT